MAYEIIKDITKFNQTGRILNAIGGIQHSTGNGEDTDEGNFNWFNTADRGGNAHVFIDFDSMRQTVEFNMQASHARSPANGDKWGVEMCETKDPAKFKIIWDKQVWLWTYLFLQVASPRITKIDINTLRSHHEENKINHAGDPTNHTDVTGYFALFNKTIEDMRIDVQKAINDILFAEAIIKFVNKKIVGSPDYWNQNCVAGKLVDGSYMNTVILRFVAMYKTVNTFQEAVQVLVDMGITGSSDYWCANAIAGKTVQGDYARSIILRMGTKF